MFESALFDICLGVFCFRCGGSGLRLAALQPLLCGSAQALKAATQAIDAQPYKHTDTFHKLPTIRQHPDEEWIKNQPNTLE